MPNMDKTVSYRIRVLGEVEAAWSDRLDSMEIAIDRSREGEPVTTLVGPLPDQAALSGVLETLYELHLRVLEVTCLDEQES